MHLKYIFAMYSFLTTFFAHNFHQVVPHELHRSAQLSPKNLKQYIKKYEIKTIVALNEDMKAIEKEKKICKKNSIDHIHITLTANRLPTKKEVESLLNVIHTSTGPLLVHCKAGADRTGLFVALWMLEKKKSSLKDALNHLNRRKYSHTQCFHPGMRQFIRIWYHLRLAYGENAFAHYNEKNYPHLATIADRIEHYKNIFKKQQQQKALQQP